MKSALGARLLLGILMAAVIVAWSPRYWPVTLLHVGIFSVSLAWILTNLYRPTTLRTSWLFVPMATAGLWGFLQLGLGTTVYRFYTSRALLYWSANAAVMFLAAQILRSPRVRRSFLNGLVYFSTAIAIIGILEYFTSPLIYWTFPVAQDLRAAGPFVYRNQFAAFIELVLPIALYRVMDDRLRRWVWVLLSAVLVAVVVAVASRTGTVLVFLEVLCLFLLGWKRRLVSGRTLALVFGELAMVAAVFIVVAGYQDVLRRFQETNPYAIRGKLTDSTVQMIRQRPVNGFGLGTWQVVYPEFATFDNSVFANEAHNDWAQWTAEGGVPFGFALALIAAGSALLGWRTLWGLGVTSVFVHSFVDYPTREPVIGAILFVLIGAMIATDVQKGRRKSQPADDPARVDMDRLLDDDAPPLRRLRPADALGEIPVVVAGPVD